MESTQSSNPKKEHKSGVSLQPLLKSYNPYAKGYYTDAAGRFGVKSSGLIVWVKPHEKFGYIEDGATREAGTSTFHKF